MLHKLTFYVIYFSVAILRYLCRAYPSHVVNHWYPQDVKAQALVDQYMAWQHANTRFQCAMYFQHKVSGLLRRHSDVYKMSRRQRR